MPTAVVSPGISLAYETFGRSTDPAVLLTTGFGAQMIAWHDEFCRMLAGKARYVVRYDNRDSGLSTRFDDHPINMDSFLAAVTAGDIETARRLAPYSLLEMAARSYDRAYRPAGIPANSRR